MLSLLAMATLQAGAQQMGATSQTIDCGQVIFKHPVTAEFEVSNNSSHPLRITGVKTSCGCTTVDYPEGSISSGDHFTIRATYDAKQMGHFNKQIGIYDEEGEQPLILTLKGVVVEEVVDFAGEYPFQIGDLRIDRNNIEFDNVNRGDRPLQKIHILNTGTQTAEPVIMHLPKYLKAEMSPSKIAPKHSGVATVTLDSRQLADFGLTQTNVYLGAKPGEKVAAEKEISVSAVLLPDFANMTEMQKAQAPQMHLSANDLNLGTFGKKKSLKGEIVITNQGQSTLQIRSLQMFTTGLKVSLNKTRINPGEEARLKVTAIAKDLRTVRSQPRILMITNDPEQAKVVINITAQ